MPYPRKGQTLKEYTKVFMSSPEAIKDYPDIKQRYAICRSLWSHRKSKASVVVNANTDNEEIYGAPESNGWQDDMKSMLKDGDVAIV